MDGRFIKKEYAYDWWFIFDKEQKYIEDMRIPFHDVGNLVAMSEDQVLALLNKYDMLEKEVIELKKENEKLKEKININMGE